MKVRRFTRILLLGAAILSVCLIGINAQDGNNSVKKCPRGWVRQGDSCVKLAQPTQDEDAARAASTAVATTATSIGYIETFLIVESAFLRLIF